MRRLLRARTVLAHGAVAAAAHARARRSSAGVRARAAAGRWCCWAPASTAAPRALPTSWPAAPCSRSIIRPRSGASARCWAGWARRRCAPSSCRGTSSASRWRELARAAGLAGPRSPRRPTFTIWEGVIPYLTEPAIASTVAAVRELVARARHRSWPSPTSSPQRCAARGAAWWRCWASRGDSAGGPTELPAWMAPHGMRLVSRRIRRRSGAPPLAAASGRARSARPAAMSPSPHPSYNRFRATLRFSESVRQ